MEKYILARINEYYLTTKNETIKMLLEDRVTQLKKGYIEYLPEIKNEPWRNELLEQEIGIDALMTL
jgi:hypothetical protein